MMPLPLLLLLSTSLTTCEGSVGVDPTRVTTQSAVEAHAGLPPTLDGPAQDGPAEQDPEEKGPRRLKDWPEAEDAAAIKREVDRLRKARTEEMGTSAHAALVEAGAAAAPFLLTVVDKEKKPEPSDRLLAVLDEITTLEHTRLLTSSFRAKRTEVRVWALLRVARFPDEGVLAEAEAALAAVPRQKKLDEKQRELELRAASLCCASAGSIAGFEALRDLARDDWGDWAEATHLALAGCRGPEATKEVLSLLAGERKEIVAGLRLLAGCGDDSALRAVGTHLDSSDNSIRVAAINACRGIVDGEPPLDKLSAFEAIEVAKQWKARL